MVQNALDLRTDAETATFEEEAVTVMAENDAALPQQEVLTRGDAAKFLYRVKYLSVTAPGMQALRLD